jgi:hypothetical protein
MPSASEIREQVASESARRNRLAVPAFAGGFLYLLSAITIASTINAAPSVGLFQGLAPALSGVAEPAVSPRTPWVKYISKHAAGLIAGGVLSAISLAVLTLLLLFVAGATRFRRPQSWAATRPLVLYGGAALALVSVGHEVVSVIESHNFAVGHDHSNKAVERALVGGTANLLVDYVELLAGLALLVGMIAAMVNALRVGLLPRWMAMIGMLSAVLIFLPGTSAELQVIPAFWIVMMGILMLGRWANGEPPAWAAGEARPWPSRAETMAAKSGGSAPAAAAAGGGSVPAPQLPASGGSSRKRRRKRGSASS